MSAAAILLDPELIGQMAALRELTASLESKRAQHQAEQTRIDRERAATLEPLERTRDEMLARISEWLCVHRDQFSRTRSVRTVHAAMGWRTTAAKVVFTHGQDHAERVLRARGHREVFQTVESLDLSELKKLPPAELRQAGVALRTGEVGFITLPNGVSFTIHPPEPGAS